ncbi:hypothetical protein F0562_009913 [Nyssa sinensis]|uniref:Uncharacterized protein n=1 Tax=Nyssa sinensis TaxID=561372 RepID=A0A5J4ZZ19_9ASTE|nr:hypothetical protein F0562_009913 [Nyssa sinensis]
MGKRKAISKKIELPWSRLMEAEKQVYQDKGLRDKEVYKTENVLAQIFQQFRSLIDFQLVFYPHTSQYILLNPAGVLHLHVV